MEGELIDFDTLLSLLPEGWEQKARDLGAWERAREIKTPAELLRLIVLYLTEGVSFAGTSAIVRLAGHCHLNKVAVYKRIRNSAEWLQWLAVQLCRQAGLLVEKPRWLKGKDVCLVDGSEVVYGGAVKTYSYLHYCIDACTLSMREMHLAMKGGEKLSRFEGFGENDIVVGDRAYGTIPGMEYLREKGSAFVLRLRGGAFKVYDGEGKEIELLEQVSDMKEGEQRSIAVSYRVPGEEKPIRICVLRKDRASEEAGLERLKRTKQRKQHGEPVSALQEAYNKYIVVATNLDEEVTTEQV
ncbi:MAG: hypothetical protein LBU28_06670 [Spirochaetaceae bacterium]|jgi:hypothetical protein|nr:hypothetical protein [Spirochaetaceae bacterium]